MEEDILPRDASCEYGVHAEAVAAELNGRCPEVFPREFTEELMRSCEAMDFARDCNGEASGLREEGVVCILLLARPPSRA